MQLAAALVHDPELLVLDEPFSGLDPVGVDVLSGVLREYAATGVPVVFSSHQLELVERLCEAVAIIKDGRLVACGRVDDLRGSGAARPCGWSSRAPRTAGSPACPRPSSIERARDGALLVGLTDGADAGRPARRRARRRAGHALQPRAPDARPTCSAAWWPR